MRTVLVTTAVLLCACSGAPITTDGGDTGADAGSDAGTGGAQIVGGCPRVLLGSTLPATFSGDTTGLPNIVTSARLEWTDAPDDALEFTAPEAGNYAIELTSANMDLGASGEDFGTTGSDSFPFTAAACPASGMTAEINGIYDHNQPNYPVALTAGQKMVIFISAPYWAATKTGAYTLKVSKVP